MRLRRRSVALAILLSLTLLALSSSPTREAQPSVPAAVTESSFMPVEVATPASDTAGGPSLASATPLASSPVGTASPPNSEPSASWRGTASWGDFGGHVVTRLPRGTRIEVVGPHGTWHGRSWGYGPAKWTGRIVDLDVRVFEDICGPRSLGLCKVTLSILG